LLNAINNIACNLLPKHINIFTVFSKHIELKTHSFVFQGKETHTGLKQHEGEQIQTVYG